MDRQREAVRMVGREELPVNTQHLILLKPIQITSNLQEIGAKGRIRKFIEFYSLSSKLLRYASMVLVNRR